MQLSGFPIGSALSFEERAHKLLSMSEAQSTYFAAILRTVHEKDAQARDDAIPSLRALAGELGEHGPAVIHDVAIAQQYASFISRCEDFMKDLGAIEEHLFRELEPALTDDQRLVLPRLRNYRERERCAVVICARFPARIDLAHLINELERREPFQAVDPAAFDLLLANYETSLTHLARRRAQRQFAAMRETAGLLAANEFDPQNATERTRRREQLHRGARMVEEQIGNLNEAYAKMLADLLIPKDGDRLTLAYQTRAYPEVWPNPFDISGIIDVALRYLPVERRPEVELASLTAQEQQRVATSEMRSRVDRWMDQLPSNGDWPPDRFAAYQSDLDELQARRRTSADQVIAAVRAAFDGAPLPTEVERAIADYKFATDNRRGRPLGLTYLP